ncbi:hypothetical protein QAD02_000704 [Eretmocerus hayati]|uniref:Uncharacterized protein n=1 Tax=Eretmocerus hayati TaxID=131215 RepID=A0ACC2NE21_9HYME|nr:hypothetical protein QAD02_000704 [Eretmocerus hayati]
MESFEKDIQTLEKDRARIVKEMKNNESQRHEVDTKIKRKVEGITSMSDSMEDCRKGVKELEADKIILIAQQNNLEQSMTMIDSQLLAKYQEMGILMTEEEEEVKLKFQSAKDKLAEHTQKKKSLEEWKKKNGNLQNVEEG